MSKVGDARRVGTVKITPSRALVSRPAAVKADKSGKGIKLEVGGVKMKLFGSGELRVKFVDDETSD